MRADVAVIGAGAFGLSTALHCALRNRSVVVVERFSAGSQASGRAAGLFKSVQADELRTGVARRSIVKATTFGEWAGVPLDVRRVGSVLVARTDAHKAYLRVERDQSRAWGADVQPLDLSGVAERVSYYEPSGREEAVWCPDDVYIEEPSSLVSAYLAACELHGVQLLESEPVLAIRAPDGRVEGLETEQRTVEAPVVVDAAGAWARGVAALAGAAAALAPVRHQLLITEPTPSIRSEDPIVRVLDAAVYLRPARRGLMVGAFEADPLPVDPRSQIADFTTDDVPLDLEVLRARAADVAREAPLAVADNVSEHRGGLFTMTPDGQFLLGPVPDVTGLWIASGCNGSGFSCSPALGESLAEWIVTGSAPPGVEAFSPGRFGLVTDDALVRDGAWQYAHYYDPGTSEHAATVRGSEAEQ
jgi:glycine/D-amino acid oxidase-like deaminating enzyme